MNAKTCFYFIAVFAFLTISCKKNKVLPPESGIYRGAFSRILTSGDTVGTGIVFFALTEGSLNFSLRGDTSSNAPYSCTGTYSIIGTDGINFNNTAFIEETGSDPFYDPYYILDTTYTYLFTDTSFIMNLNIGTTVYNYNLTPY